MDSDGSCLAGDLFCVGSGSNLAYSILDSSSADLNDDHKKDGIIKNLNANYTIVNQDFESAVNTALWAVRHATVRDGFSGGYINVLRINATGVHHVKRIDSRSLQHI